MSPITAFVFYVIFAVGGLALYFAMPRLHRPTAMVGGILGLAAVMGLVIFFAARLVGPNGTSGLFYAFSAIAVLSAARVITHTKPVYSAIYVVVAVIAVAAILVLQQAEFLAVALVIIYAGAILVTYLFVIMLAQQPGSPTHDRQAREPFAATVAGFLLMGLVAGTAGQVVLEPSAPVQAHGALASSVDLGNTLAMGTLLMTKYVVVLEIAGILLLVSMIGAIALSKKRVPVEVIRAPRAPLGEIGKEVEPF